MRSQYVVWSTNKAAALGIYLARLEWGDIYKLLQKIIRSKGGKMDMASLMGGIKDRTSKEFLVMQSFQLEKTWVRLSWPWQAGDGLYSTLLERHERCRTWCAHNYPTLLQFFGRLLLGIIVCPSRLQLSRFITLLGRLRLSGDLPL